MTKSEKVIRGLEAVKETLADMRDWHGMTWVDDAITLLKAQEPIKPRREIRGCGFRWFCGNCGVNIEPNHMYCRICGRAVK